MPPGKTHRNHDPETRDPETHDPETHDPETHDPETRDPETRDPETRDPETHDPETHDGRIRAVGFHADLQIFHHHPSIQKGGSVRWGFTQTCKYSIIILNPCNLKGETPWCPKRLKG